MDELSELRDELRELTDRVSRLEWERDDPLRTKLAQTTDQRITSLEEDRKRVWMAGWAVVLFVLTVASDVLKRMFLQ